MSAEIEQPKVEKKEKETTWTYAVGSAKDQGGRDYMEDEAYVSRRMEVFPVVAAIDGMGGMGNGDEAAELTKKSLDSIENRGGPEILNNMMDAANLANVEIWQKNSSEGKKMGATIAAVGMDEEKKQTHFVWSGDAKGYVWSRVPRHAKRYYEPGDARGLRNLSQVTRDHSYVENLRGGDLLNTQKLEPHPRSGEIFGGLAGDKTPIESESVDWFEGDIYVVSSDGLYACGITHERIEQVCGKVDRGELTLDDASKLLVDEANMDVGGVLKGLHERRYLMDEVKALLPPVAESSDSDDVINERIRRRDELLLEVSVSTENGLRDIVSTLERENLVWKHAGADNLSVVMMRAEKGEGEEDEEYALKPVWEMNWEELGEEINEMEMRALDHFSGYVPGEPPYNLGTEVYRWYELTRVRETIPYRSNEVDEQIRNGDLDLGEVDIAATQQEMEELVIRMQDEGKDSVSDWDPDVLKQYFYLRALLEKKSAEDDVSTSEESVVVEEADSVEEVEFSQEFVAAFRMKRSELRGMKLNAPVKLDYMLPEANYRIKRAVESVVIEVEELEETADVVEDDRDLGSYEVEVVDTGTSVEDDDVQVDMVTEKAPILTVEGNQKVAQEFAKRLREHTHDWVSSQRMYNETDWYSNLDLVDLADRWGIPMVTSVHGRHFYLVLEPPEVSDIGWVNVNVYDPFKNENQTLTFHSWKEYSESANISHATRKMYERGTAYDYDLSDDESLKESRVLDVKQVQMQFDGHNCGPMVLFMAAMRAGVMPGDNEFKSWGRDKMMEDLGIKVLLREEIVGEDGVRKDLLRNGIHDAKIQLGYTDNELRAGGRDLGQKAFREWVVAGTKIKFKNGQIELEKSKDERAMSADLIDSLRRESTLVRHFSSEGKSKGETARVKDRDVEYWENGGDLVYRREDSGGLLEYCQDSMGLMSVDLPDGRTVKVGLVADGVGSTNEGSFASRVISNVVMRTLRDELVGREEDFDAGMLITEAVSKAEAALQAIDVDEFISAYGVKMDQIPTWWAQGAKDNFKSVAANQLRKITATTLQVVLAVENGDDVDVHYLNYGDGGCEIVSDEVHESMGNSYDAQTAPDQITYGVAAKDASHYADYIEHKRFTKKEGERLSVALYSDALLKIDEVKEENGPEKFVRKVIESDARVAILDDAAERAGDDFSYVMVQF